MKKWQLGSNLYIASFARLQSLIQRGVPMDLPLRQRRRFIEKILPSLFKRVSL